MRKHGSAVFLMELVTVVLFFSLSSVITLRLFAASRTQEQRSARCSSAVEWAEDVSEQIYVKGEAFFDGWSVFERDTGRRYSKPDGNGLSMDVTVQAETASGGMLESYDVCVFDGNTGQELCRLPVKRYCAGEAAS